MNPIRRAWCRTFQAAFRIALPLLPYREPKILHSVEEVPGVLASQGLTSALLVTDAGIAALGLAHALEGALAAAGISCAVYDGTVANPTVANVEAALGVYRDHGCQAIVGFGGGSAMDCAKVVGARIVRPNVPVKRMKGVLKVLHRLPFTVAERFFADSPRGGAGCRGDA